MPTIRTLLPTTLAVVTVLAQDMPIPDLSGDIICDGTIRPDYAECSDSLLEQTFDGMTVGPEFMQGQTIAGEDCQFRALKCGANTAGEFTLDDFSSMYPLVERQCGSFPAGGVYRSGDACIYIDTPNNTFGPETKKMRKRDTESTPVPLPVSPMLEERKKKEERRDLVKEAADLEKKDCDPPADKCYNYVEQVYLTGIRGLEQRVCDNILPKGGRCDQSRSVTTTESFSFGVDVGSGIKDVVDVTASFSEEVSESSTETITTAITVDCEDGGYVVWYPLLEVSKGECGSGPGNICDGGCIADTITECQYQKPITSGEGKLSGEYAIQCL